VRIHHGIRVIRLLHDGEKDLTNGEVRYMEKQLVAVMLQGAMAPCTNRAELPTARHLKGSNRSAVLSLDTFIIPDNQVQHRVRRSSDSLSGEPAMVVPVLKAPL